VRIGGNIGNPISLEIIMNTPLRFVAVLSTVAIFGLVSLDASAASIRVRCEKSATRSKVSVDGANLLPGNYRARIISGSNARNSPLAPTVGDEVGFDFDSAPGQVGATPIGPNFIQNLTVTAKIINPLGFAVASDTEICQRK
jgi:hypothetical protein